MEVIKLEEAGYAAAKYGMSLSFKDRATDRNEWWGFQPLKSDKYYPMLERKARYDKVLIANAPRNGGHNKFLEHIMVWLDIEAPRYWWSEFDTYRIGVSKQSESTMHTLSKREVTIDDFQETEGGYNLSEEDLIWINECIDSGKIQRMKSVLPEAYLQRREVVLNYKVLAHIIAQRHDHRLPEWQFFINEIYKQVKNPELLPDRSKL